MTTKQAFFEMTGRILGAMPGMIELTDLECAWLRASLDDPRSSYDAAENIRRHYEALLVWNKAQRQAKIKAAKQLGRPAESDVERRRKRVKQLDAQGKGSKDIRKIMESEGYEGITRNIIWADKRRRR